MIETVSCAKAMMQYFGRLPGQTLGDFMAELRALDASDRAYFTAGLIQNGYNVQG